jgi:hypothetical protein
MLGMDLSVSYLLMNILLNPAHLASSCCERPLFFLNSWISPNKVDTVKSNLLILEIVQTDLEFGNPMSNVFVSGCNKPQYTQRWPVKRS